MNELVNKIKERQPFKCSDWDELCLALVETYDYRWGISIFWILSQIRYIKQFEKCSGSWNVPLLWVDPTSAKDMYFYKVFRQPKFCGKEEIVYEFHQNKVPLNQWLKSEISGSPGLTGIQHPEHAKFHMLCTQQQASEYVKSRDKCSLFENHSPVICHVKARQLQTVDLIYVPPQQFVWGIDAKEIYVPL